jgi:hypothetical protein
MDTRYINATLALCCASWLAATGPALAEEAKPEAKTRQTDDDGRPHQVQATAEDLRLRSRGHQGLPRMPHRGRRPDPPHQALEVGVHESRHQAGAGQEEGAQQLLHLDPLQLRLLHVLPRRLRLEGCELRLHKQENVDCIVCHDTTGNYKKPPGFAGNPVTKDTEFPPGSGKIIKGIDLRRSRRRSASRVATPAAACHFNGGGGDGVKHGDMDSSLAAPTKDIDVHMDAEGLDFTCGTCHKTSSHDVAGSRYTPTAKDDKGVQVRGKAGSGNPATCVACHDNAPHKKEARLNQHATKIACQTCHIPTYARGGIATKMTWDWSTAGKRDAEGKHITLKDAKGRITYESRKGDFTLAENVKPEYAWFNGNVQYTLLTDKIEKSEQRTRSTRWAAARPTASR